MRFIPPMITYIERPNKQSTAPFEQLAHLPNLLSLFTCRILDSLVSSQMHDTAEPYAFRLVPIKHLT